MVDIKTQTQTQTKREDPRASRKESRQRRLHMVSSGKAPMVKVYASSETVRETLRHANGTRFRDALDQAVEWPNDTFTLRRIAEGSVRTDGPGAAEQPTANEAHNPRQQSAARKTAAAKDESSKDESSNESSRNGKSKPQPQPQPSSPQPSHPSA